MIVLSLFFVACSSTKDYDRTVTYVERDKFMGDWYIIAGRFINPEEKVFNATESYAWNGKEKRIDVTYRYNLGSLNGEKKEIKQKAWIQTPDNAYWKIQMTWPFKRDFLIIGLAANYRWTAVGTPDQKNLWIMCRDTHFTQTEVEFVLNQLKKKGYDTSNVVYVPHEDQAIP
jgi:apolipoprotein D and lipocalin family protein